MNNAVFAGFWLVLRLGKRRILYGLVKNILVYLLQIFSTQNYILFKISALFWFILKIFLKFRTYWPRYFVEICSQSYEKSLFYFM